MPCWTYASASRPVLPVPPHPAGVMVLFVLCTSPQGIKFLMHAFGLNLRYLGHVRRALFSSSLLDSAAGARATLASDVLVEALARTMKWDLWAAMRRGHAASEDAVVMTVSEGMPHVHERMVARWNKLFFKHTKWSHNTHARGLSSHVSVSVSVLEAKARRRFPGLLANTEHLPLFDTFSSGSSSPTGDSATTLIVDLAVLVPRVCALTGLVLTAAGADAAIRGARLSPDHVAQVWTCPLPFSRGCASCACPPLVVGLPGGACLSPHGHPTTGRGHHLPRVSCVGGVQ